MDSKEVKTTTKIQAGMMRIRIPTTTVAKSFTKAKNKTSFPWRDKRLKKRFHWTELVNPKLQKITLENKNERISYVMELIDEPTKWFLHGDEVKASTWYRYTVSNTEELHEWGIIRIVKEINNLLRQGCVIKEIIQ